MSCQWPRDFRTDAAELRRYLSVSNIPAPSKTRWYSVELFRAGAFFSGDSSLQRARAKEPK